MSEFKIEKSVPFPRGKATKYHDWPFGQMEISDSFFVPVSGSRADRAHAQSGALQAARHERNKGKKFMTRKEEGGFRMWRIL